ncbi:MAG TPA: hypothetical protein VH765_00655 [Xanthobacteraceae bacterium]|jgi:hypothetical protein
MQKLAIATAAFALLATPAMAQQAENYVQAAPSPYGPTYGYGAPYGYAAPYGQAFFGTAYSREFDIATEPDPNVRLELRRDQTLNLDQRP